LLKIKRTFSVANVNCLQAGTTGAVAEDAPDIRRHTFYEFGCRLDVCRAKSGSYIELLISVRLAAFVCI
jgi:hypothetical protein